jgi:4'-phosphopantetheinyl transferase
VEQLRPLAFMPLAQRFFTPQEAAVLGRLPEKEQQRAFFRLWTAKESLLKALGTGLSRPLSSVPVMLGETLTTPVEGFTLGEYPLDGYQLTVCSKAPLPDSVHIME